MSADRIAMQAYLSKALRRAGIKLVLGLAFVAALVGIRIVTATPTGVEGEVAELERFEIEQAAAEAAGTASDEGDHAANADSASARGSEPRPSSSGPSATDGLDLDRMVRCITGGSARYMRAADCATRGGGLEELPPPEPEAGATPSER